MKGFFSPKFSIQKAQISKSSKHPAIVLDWKSVVMVYTIHICTEREASNDKYLLQIIVPFKTQLYKK